MSSLARHDMVVQQCAAELCVRALVTRGAGARLRALARRGTRPLSSPSSISRYIPDIWISVTGLNHVSIPKIDSHNGYV